MRMGEKTTIQQLIDLGMKTRREVLGDEYVDNAIVNTEQFDKRFQEMLTSSAWGTVWSNETLSKRDRSLVTVTLLASLGHYEELALHLEATQNTGLSQTDVGEAFLHLAIYGGIPAARNAFRVAKEVFSET